MGIINLRDWQAGDAMHCVHCGSFDVESTDGDRIQVWPLLGERAQATGGGRVLSVDGITLDAQLTLYECGNCRKSCYGVLVYLADTPEVSAEWLETHFDMCDEVPADYTLEAVEAHHPALPALWSVGKHDADGVIVEHHMFGPFVPTDELVGPYGVSSCSHSDTWKAAAQLVIRVWPYLTQDALA